MSLRLQMKKKPEPYEVPDGSQTFTSLVQICHSNYGRDGTYTVRFCEYLKFRPVWHMPGFKKPPPATERRLKT